MIYKQVIFIHIKTSKICKLIKLNYKLFLKIIKHTQHKYLDENYFFYMLINLLINIFVYYGLIFYVNDILNKTTKFRGNGKNMINPHIVK